MVIVLTGSRSHIVHRPFPQDDPGLRSPDIPKANQVLGWNPRTQLVEGLQQTIEYFGALLSDERIKRRIIYQANRCVAP
jgi:UDP-glucuronate decarboxylase